MLDQAYQTEIHKRAAHYCFLGKKINLLLAQNLKLIGRCILVQFGSSPVFNEKSVFALVYSHVVVRIRLRGKSGESNNTVGFR